MWLGLDGEYAAEGLPHVTKIQRKPRGVGTECKSLCDSMTNIMLRLDLMEGKTRQAEKPFGPGGTGQVLRLTQPYFGTRRVVIGDSAFASVKTATECLDNGLHFMGIVKTAHKQYPQQYLKGKAENYGRDKEHERGGWLVLESKHTVAGAEKPVYAHAWYDRKSKLIVSTCGTTTPGTMSIRPRHTKYLHEGVWTTRRFEKRVPRTMMIQMMFEAFSQVDIHDHYRQGSLHLEISWITRKWHHRLFATVLGICVVDAFFAFRYEHPDNSINFTEFWGKLTLSLINNHYLGARVNTRNNGIDSDDEEVTL